MRDVLLTDSYRSGVGLSETVCLSATAKVVRLYAERIGLTTYNTAWGKACFDLFTRDGGTGAPPNVIFFIDNPGGVLSARSLTVEGTLWTG